MITTRPHFLSIKEDLDSGPEFRRALLAEAINSMIEGDVQTSKIVLRDYVRGTIGFVALGKALDKSPKSLMRMLSLQSNPRARDLFEIFAHLQRVEGVPLRLEIAPLEASVAV